jgi:hypothetical protein
MEASLLEVLEGCSELGVWLAGRGGERVALGGRCRQ